MKNNAKDYIFFIFYFHFNCARAEAKREGQSSERQSSEEQQQAIQLGVTLPPMQTNNQSFLIAYLLFYKTLF